MNVDRKNVNSLFKVAVQYEVPTYQRRYVWDKSNWLSLWNDIKKNAERKSERHFTGAIVTRILPTSDGNSGTIDKYEIIDGQQRLTTFQLILCVFRDLCRSGTYCDKYDLAKSAEGHITNPTSDVDGDPEIIEGDSVIKSVYKLLLTDYDSKAFRMIVNSQGADTGHSIHQAYNYFKTEIENYVSADYNKMLQLVNSMIDRFEVAQINLERTDQSQEIFLSINATGRQLSEFDYLRNYIFLRIPEKEECEKLYNDSWYKFEKNPSWTTEKLNEFLFVFLIAKKGTRIFQNDAKLFDLYRDEYLMELSDDKKNLKYEVDQLERYADAYEELDESSGIGSRMQFYKDLGTYVEVDSDNSRMELQHNRNIACVQSFILYLKNELDIPDSELYTVFDILESYVVRRLLVDTVDNRYAYETIESFLNQIVTDRDSEQFTVAGLIQYLNSGLRKWIKNTQIRALFRNSGSRDQNTAKRYQGSLLFTERYILYRIENLKRERAGEDKLRFEDFYYTQERMLSTQQLKREVWASLGNATFRAGGRQRIVTFEKQKEFLGSPENAVLILNREICDHEGTWDADAISTREDDLLFCFFELWPPAEHFTQAITGRPKGSDLNFSQWIIKILSAKGKKFRFVTYSGHSTPSRINVTQDRISELKKSDILFVCSEKAWKDLRYNYVNRTDVRSQKLQPVLDTSEQFQVNDTLLQLARDGKYPVTAVTRLGHELQGEIENFDDEAIYLQIKGHEVIVLKSSLLECVVEAVEDPHSGVIEKWNGDDLYGYVKCNKLPRLQIAVKSDFLDQSVLSKKLQPGIKVKFNKIVQKDEIFHFQAHNVEPITIGELHHGKVEWFKTATGSGFLTSENYPFNVYVHKSQVVPLKDVNLIRQGQLVEFKIAETTEGQSSVALDVQVKP